MQSKFDQVDSYVVWQDSDGKFLGCNKRFLGLYGITSAKQLVNKSYFDFFDNSVANILRNNDLKVLAERKALTFKEFLKFKKETYTLFSYKATFSDSNNNNVSGIFTISTMLSRKHEIFDNRCYDKIALTNIVRDLPGHIYWKDKEGQYLGCNDRQANSLGFKSGNAVIGKKDSELPWGTQIASTFRSNDILVMNTGRTEVIEEKIMIEHKPHIFLSQKSPLKDFDGNILGVLGVSLDITKQKALEKQYVRKVIELQQALEVKRSFINNASHEIRTPLHVTTNVINELKANFDTLTDADKKQYINIVIKNQNRLMSLLNGLLDLGKANSGRLLCVFKKYDLAYLLKEVISEFSMLTKNIYLKTCSQKILLYCDQERLKQVFRNIVSNSIKYGGRDKDINICISDCIDCFEVSIQDLGVGIPEAERSNVFEPFFESSRTKSRAGGTGLGLAICKKIISEHSGEIYVDSKIKEGTKIMVKIPKKFMKKQHVLMIDDDQSILDSTHLILKNSSYKLTTLGSGQEAIDFFKTCEKVDIVLLDMLMHDMYGTEVLKAMRTYGHLNNVPVIIQTGITDEMFIKEALKLGAVTVLHKPYSGEQLKKCLDKSFDNKH